MFWLEWTHRTPDQTSWFISLWTLFTEWKLAFLFFRLMGNPLRSFCSLMCPWVLSDPQLKSKKKELIKERKSDDASVWPVKKICSYTIWFFFPFFFPFFCINNRRFDRNTDVHLGLSKTAKGSHFLLDENRWWDYKSFQCTGVEE